MARDILDFATLQDDAVAVVEAVVSKQLDGKAFRASKVADWCTQVAEAAVADLRGLTENFKFVVTCCIKQNTVGGGLRSSTTAFWDEATDGSCTIRWNNKTMAAIVVVFATLM